MLSSRVYNCIYKSKGPCCNRFGQFHIDLSLLIWFSEIQHCELYVILCKEVFYVQIRKATSAHHRAIFSDLPLIWVLVGGCLGYPTHACTHAKKYMFRNCIWPNTWISCLTCVGGMHAHVCSHMHGGSTHTHIHPQTQEVSNH